MIGYGGSVNMYGTDMSVFKIVKVRDEWSCQKCRNKIHKKQYCWGKDYQKFCIKCGFEVIKSFIGQIDDFSKDLKNKMEQETKDKDKYITNNMVESL